MKLDDRLKRVDDNRIALPNKYDIPITLFANQEVPVESAAVTELQELLNVHDTVERFHELSPESFDEPPSISRIAVTPDFHKARGIPVGTVLATQGFVIPQAIGNDINCGMRLHLTSLTRSDLEGRGDELETALRHLYFEGGRSIPMTQQQRYAMFTQGLMGLLESTPKDLDQGTWRWFHEMTNEAELEKVDRQGSLLADNAVGLDDFMGTKDQLTRDSQIGSIGGGNHFVEVQVVDEVLDGTTAHAWGLKKDMVTIMVHTGSVSIGHLCGERYRDVVRKLFPETLKYPNNNIFVLPLGERHSATAKSFWYSLNNAGNFAFANRMFLALMAFEGLHRVFGGVSGALLYDAPHNFLWEEIVDGQSVVVHRKGACPARGYEAMSDTRFAYYGEPVLVPGSMGASSFVLAGRGNAESLWSASHGAGRVLSRGDALQGNDAEFIEFMKRFRVVTPTDLRRQDIRARADIFDRKMDEIKQEAPFAYKGIGEIVKTLDNSQIAKPVVELTPLLTVKG